MRIARLVVLALVVGACSTAPAAPADPTDDIRAVIVRTEGMNNARDVDGWTELFEDGAVYMPPGQPAVTTRDGLRDVAQAGFSRWRSEIRITPEEIIPAGDWVFARSTVSGTVTPVAGGDAMPVDVKQIAIYHRQADGTWKIARLITNSNR